MSHWNYRVMFKDGQVAIHEVFYAADGGITGYTEEPVFPRAESIDHLIKEFERYRLALAEPVMDYATLETEAAARRG